MIQYLLNKYLSAFLFYFVLDSLTNFGIEILIKSMKNLKTWIKPQLIEEELINTAVPKVTNVSEHNSFSS